MSRGVEDFSQVLSRKQILLAFGKLVAKELEKNGLIDLDHPSSQVAELNRTRSTTIVLELGAEALNMALERR